MLKSNYVTTIKKVLANENLFSTILGSTTPTLIKVSRYFSLLFEPLQSSIYPLLFQGHTVLFLKSDTVVYFLFFRFNNNIPYFTNFHIYMFQFNFLISLLKCFFLCFKSSALGIFFENNSICSARFFHSSFAQMYE